MVPRRHVVSIADLSSDEYDDIWKLVRDVLEQLQTQHGVEAFNIGVNDGTGIGISVPSIS